MREEMWKERAGDMALSSDEVMNRGVYIFQMGSFTELTSEQYLK